MKLVPIVDITPGSTGWQDVDVSSYVDAGNTAGVIVLSVFDYYSADYVGIRKNGSTDNRTVVISSQRTCSYHYIGVDSNDILEVYENAAGRIKYYLIGYVGNDEGSFFTNGIDKKHATTGSWADIDISGDTGADTAKIAFFEMAVAAGNNRGIRQNGSTDNRKVDFAYSFGAAMAVDANEILEYYQTASKEIYLTGYQTTNFTAITNAIDKSTATTNLFETVDCSANIQEGSDIGFFQILSAGYQGMFRSRGDYFSIDDGSNNGMYEVISYQIFMPIGIDDMGCVEQRISNAAVDLYLWGYGTQTNTMPWVKGSITPCQNNQEKRVASATTWLDWDVSSYIPSGAEGVIIRIRNADGSTGYDAGVRKNGSTDTILREIRYNGGVAIVGIGVDDNRVLEIYSESIYVVYFDLLGYIVDGKGTFFTNAVDKSLSATSAWTDIDISANTGAETASVAFFIAQNTDAGANTYYYGFRKNGSTDNRTSGYLYSARYAGAAMAVDGSEILEGYISNTAVDFYLTGYLTSGVYSWDNAKDYSTGSTNSYQPVDVSGDVTENCSGLFLTSYATANSTYIFNHRYSYGSLYSLRNYFYSQQYFWTGVVSGLRAFMQRIDSTSNDLYLWGYTEEIPSVVEPTVTTQAATVVTPTTCTGNGNITATGGANATRRGFCYKAGSSGDPTTADSVAYDDGDYGTGAYTKGITGLSAGTAYRVRAYAVNSAGTGYGDTVQVNTPSEVAPTKSLKYCVEKAASAKTKSLKYTVTTTPSAKTKSLGYNITTTPSAKTKGLIYIIKAPESATKSLKYTVLTTPSAKEKSLQYEILTTPGAIEKGLVYDIKAPISSVTKGLIYCVKTTPGTKEKNLSYNILFQTIAVEKGLIYDIKTEQSKTKSLKYAIDYIPTAPTKELIYCIKAESKKEKDLTYEIKVGVPHSIEKGLTYRIKLEKSKTKGLIYAIKPEVAIQKGLIYDIKSPVSKEKQLKYEIGTTDQVAKGLVYSIKTEQSKTKGLIYAIDLATAKTKDLTYRIKTEEKQTKGLTYTIKYAPVAIEKSLKYAVLFQTVSKEKGLIYEIKTDTGINKSLKYVISITPSAITKGLTYSVTGISSIEKSLGYRIKTEASKTKGLVYTIKLPEAINKNIKYCVNLPTKTTKGLKYSIEITPAGITKGLTYEIKRQDSIAKGLSYKVKTQSKAEKTLKYSITTEPSAITKGLIYSVRQQIQSNKALEYRIGVELAKTKSLAYSVKVESKATKALKYEVILPLYTTKSVKYTIKITPNAKEKALKYEIREAKAITKGLSYIVREVKSIEKSLQYGIIKQKSKAKSLKYGVKTEVTATKSLKYEVIEGYKITKSLKYTVLISPAAMTKSLQYVIEIDPYSQMTSPYSTQTDIYSDKTSPYSRFPIVN